jgi:hypothetical protein
MENQQLIIRNDLAFASSMIEQIKILPQERYGMKL